jgi:hypothetical protein
LKPCTFFFKRGNKQTGGGFTPLPAPLPIRYSLGRLHGRIHEKFRDFEIIPYPNQGHQSGGQSPGSVTKFLNTRIHKID